MKKLLGIVVLGLLLSGNAYADNHWKKFLIKKSDNPEYSLYNIIIQDFNNYITDVYQDDSCQNIPMQVETHLVDFTDCVYLNTKKYLNRNEINFQKIVEAEHDNYIQIRSRAEILHKKWYRGDIQNMESEVYQFNENWKRSFTDKNFYTKKIWKEFAELQQLNSLAKKDKEKETKKVVSQSGSGFFINNKGYFVTNNHVVDGCKQSQITFNEKSVNAELIAKDETLDLALLRANVKPKDYLNISDDPPEKMQKVFVAGYPFGKGLSDDLKFSQGIISSVKGFGDNSNQIQIDAAINSGNSGGPIVNEDGDLVAVAVSGLDKSKSEGIGFGIKASSVKNFLEVNDAKYSSSSLISFGMSNKKLNKLMEASAVYTFCN